MSNEYWLHPDQVEPEDIGHCEALAVLDGYLQQVCGIDLDRLLDLLHAFSEAGEYSNERQKRRARECRRLLCAIARMEMVDD
jgi:hypothetical protein